MIDSSTATDLIHYGVTALAIDLFVPGNILLGGFSDLRTSNGTDISGVAGHPSMYGYQEGVGENAQFYGISGIGQITTTKVVVADSYNKCLRMIDRTTRSTSQFSGLCGNDDSLFMKPTDLKLDLKNGSQLLVADDEGDVRAVDVGTGSISTFAESNFSCSVKGLTQDKAGNVFLTCGNKIYMISYCTRRFTVISGADSNGFTDGSLVDARFYLPQNLFFVANYTLLVADRLNYKLRWIDLSAGTVASSNACRGANDYCKPSSLLLTDDALFLGSDTDTMQKFTCQYN